MSWMRAGEKSEGGINRVALVGALVAVFAGVFVVLVAVNHARHGTGIAPVNAAQDAYAPKLPITSLKMSEAGNMAGGKETYIEGQITNNGGATVTGATAQVLFRNSAHEVVRNESVPVRLIRTRTPYTDIQEISAAPIKPGETREFQLIVEQDIPEWNGEYPEVKLIKVETK